MKLTIVILCSTCTASKGRTQVRFLVKYNPLECHELRKPSFNSNMNNFKVKAIRAKTVSNFCKCISNLETVLELNHPNHFSLLHFQ